MTSLRIGFVGCGRWSGRRIYPSLRAAGLELAAVCGRSPEKTKARADVYRVAEIFDDPARMCREAGLDAVLVVAGPRGHYEVGRSITRWATWI